MLWQGIQTLLVLLLVVGLAVVLLRRLGRRTGGVGTVRVAEWTPLGPGRALALVDVGEERLLLGVTAQSIALLRELGSAPPAPPRPTVPWLELVRSALARRDRPEGDPKGAGPASFAGWLAAALRARGGEAPPVPLPVPAADDPLRALIERVRRRATGPRR